MRFRKGIEHDPKDYRYLIIIDKRIGTLYPKREQKVLVIKEA